MGCTVYLFNFRSTVSVKGRVPGPYHQHGLTLIPTWKSNYTHYKAWYEIAYLFPNFNGVTVEVWEWIHNFIPHFTGHVITYPCWDNRGPGDTNTTVTARIMALCCIYLHISLKNYNPALWNAIKRCADMRKINGEKTGFRINIITGCVVYIYVAFVIFVLKWKAKLKCHFYSMPTLIRGLT